MTTNTDKLAAHMALVKTLATRAAVSGAISLDDLEAVEASAEALEAAGRVQQAEPVAVLRFQSDTPGHENDMPAVVSCNWLPDGDYRVYLAAPAERAPAPTVPTVCDGKEQEGFVSWAEGERMDMSEHPLHWLFLNEKTYAARQGWKAALAYVGKVFDAPTAQEASKPVQPCIACGVENGHTPNCARERWMPAASKPVQAEAPPGYRLAPVSVGQWAYRTQPAYNMYEHGFEAARKELRNLLEDAPIAPQAEAPAPALLEAVDTLLDEAPCNCSHKRRFEDGEHVAGCYLFDLNLARLATQPPAIPAAPAVQASGEVVEREALVYAKQLAQSLFNKYFANDEHYASGRATWRLEGDLLGVLTQIDNMCAGLSRAALASPPASGEKQG